MRLKNRFCVFIIPHVLIGIQKRNGFTHQLNFYVRSIEHGVEIILHLLHDADGINTTAHLQREDAVFRANGQIIVVYLPGRRNSCFQASLALLAADHDITLVGMRGIDLHPRTRKNNGAARFRQ